jgi:formamidopyrimidine-DNA glycosylase
LADAQPAGAEPLAEDFTARSLADLLAGSRQNIKAWLLRQDRLVGLGNIYASEILHAARISPLRQAGSLDRADVGRLYRAKRRILRHAIEQRGTTFSDFQGTDGRTGGFRRYLAVFARAGAPCRRCKTPIERIVQNGRSTFYCPTCAR